MKKNCRIFFLFSISIGIIILCLSGCYLNQPLQKTGSRPADLVIINAKIFTSNARQPYADSIAVKGGRITYVGSFEGAGDFVGPDTHIMDGKERLITPGFVDNHCHVLWIGGMSYLQPPDLFECVTMNDILAKVRERARKNPGLPVIGGIGWRMNQLPEGPRKEILDSVVSDRPVMLMSYSGQAGWLNSRAIKLMRERNPAAFERLAPVRDPRTGEYTGECRRYHVVNILDYFSWEELGPKVEEGIMKSMTDILDEALSYGVTTMHDVQIYPEFIPLILKFRDRGGLDKVRVRGAYFVGRERLENPVRLRKDLAEWKAIGQKENGPHLRLGQSLKFYIDGTLDNRTSFLMRPYSDDPSRYGTPDWSQEEFNRVIEIADNLKLQCLTHNTGDAGARRVINAYERALKVNGMRDARHALEHCEMPVPEDWLRMARYGMIASMQPQHFYGDEMCEKALGFERLQGWMPWKSLESAGVRVSFGTDWAAGPINPAYGLLLAALRVNFRGDRNWGPGEAVDIETGIRHWTADSAYNLFMEDDIGTLEVGKYADLVIFNTDLREMSTPWFMLTHKLELGAMDDFVDVTMLAGHPVYIKEGVLLDFPQKNYKEYKTINKTKEFNSYLKGIGEGLQWANEELAARGSKALYCKPQTEVMRIDEYTEILKKEVSENAAELHDDMPVGLILLNGLMKRFPCK
jgi:predicted amidohydrolase YtcJ